MRMVDNPTISPYIHQGPAQLKLDRQEVYEGDAWRESIVLSGGKIPFNLHGKAIYPSVCVEYMAEANGPTRYGRVKGYIERSQGPNCSPEPFFEIEPLLSNNDLHLWNRSDEERPRSSTSDLVEGNTNQLELLVLYTQTVVIPASSLVR